VLDLHRGSGQSTRALRGSVVALVVVAASALAGCPPPGTPPARPLGGLAVACEPDDAQLFVDDRFVGSVASLRQRSLQLPEGLHRIELRRDGFFPHFAEVTTVKGVRQKLEVRLRKEPY
jgi:hypothetical protein